MIEYRGKVELKDGERIDDLERNGYGIIQDPGNFCFGMDAVLLSGFADVRKGGIAVDLGTGTGIIPILLEAKTGGAAFYGVEIQERMADMARRSVQLNGLEDKVHIVNADIRDMLSALKNGSHSGQKKDSSHKSEQYPAINNGTPDYRDDTETSSLSENVCNPDELHSLMSRLSGRADTVTSNPPYMKVMHGLKNPEDAKAIARHEVCCTLKDVCMAAAMLLKAGGHFYMVHRPLRLPEIITELKSCRLEPKRIKPVYPFADREANMVLIDAVKGGGQECRFEKPIIVYRSEGVYTDEIHEIYGY